MRTGTLLGSLALGLLCSCVAGPDHGSGGGADSVVDATSDAKHPTGPVITKLQTNDATLLVHARGGEVRFSVERDGQVVASDLVLGELQARHATLADAYQSGMANGGDGKTYLDATLDSEHQPDPGARPDDGLRPSDPFSPRSF